MPSPPNRVAPWQLGRGGADSIHRLGNAVWSRLGHEQVFFSQ